MADQPEFNDVEPDPEVTEELAAAQHLGDSSRSQLINKLDEYTDRSPELSGGDVDAAWEDSDVGEESVGGGNPTPDQSMVEEEGEALGYTYEDNEPLRPADKIGDRDKDRWELDPASAEDFGDTSD